MRIWFASFVILFAMTEFYQWVKHFTVPLPVFILGGVLLAIASNSNKRVNLSFLPKSAQAVIDSTPSNPVQLPNSNPQPPRSISFTIKQPEQLKD